MFIGTFLSLLLYNIPKYAMAGVMTDEYQTYYSILFMPSFVISLMCEFVFKPTITTIAELWWENNVKKFTLYILRIIGIILVCCVAVVAGGHLIGRTLLEIIYGVDLSPYKLHFVVLLIGGGISAEVYMIYNILIAIRWGKCLLPVYSITAVITIAAARILVPVSYTHLDVYKRQTLHISRTMQSTYCKVCFQISITSKIISHNTRCV